MSSRGVAVDFSDGDGDGDVVMIEHDDVSNYNPGQILPVTPEDMQKIRSWLQPTSYDIAGGEYRKHSSSHVAGTGDWLTSGATYQDWLQGEEHGLLWIKGIPGSGKSVMAANLIGEIAKSNPGCPVLFFFFRQIIEANHKPEALLRDWMGQVLEYSPPLQQQLKTYVQARRSIESVSMEDMLKDLQLAFSNLPGKVFCVADALDEMDQGNDAFLQALGSLGNWKPAQVKILITSRPVPTVEVPLRKISCLHLRLQENLVDIDISTYVRYALSNSAIPESQWQTIMDAVPGRANGLFLYAKLAMDAFLEPGADINIVLSQLPADLNVLYTDLLKDHAQRSGVAADIQHLILQAVTHATRPLRLLELAEMIKVNSPDGSTRDLKATKNLIRAACGPLLEILADETVSVIHHSFTEYLKGMTRSDDGTGYPILQMGQTHAQLALACLRYLGAGCFDDVQMEDEDEDGGLDYESDNYAFMDQNTVPNIEIQLRLKHPFFDYAASNWHDHIHRSERSRYDQTELNAELHKFLGDTQARKAWLQIKWPNSTGGTQKITQLHIAAKAGLISYIREILPTAEVDALDRHGHTALWLAASEGHAAILRELIAAGANPDHEDGLHGLKPLHEAASKNHHEAIRVLLEAGVDPLTVKSREYPEPMCGNAPTSVGQTPLMYACHAGHLEAVDTFLSFITELKTVHRALAWAAETGRSKIVARILQYPGVDVNTRVRGDTPLYLACGNPNLETIRNLLEAGADPSIDCNDVGDEWGGMGRCHILGNNLNCIHKLCSLGSPGNHQTEADNGDLQSIFSLLVDAGVDIHQPTYTGRTALHGAIGSPVLTRLLLDAGADANATDSLGNSPLHQVTDADVMALLVELGGADIDLVRKDGCTPLLSMLGSHHSDLIVKFLEYGPDCSAVNENGNGVLHIALNQWSSGDAILQALLKRGADPNMRNREGLTPLLSMRRVFSDYKEIVGILLEAGADINATNKHGATFLFHMLQHNPGGGSNDDSHKDIKYLIDRGASITTRDFNGRTILHEVARCRGWEQGSPNRRSKKVSRLDFFLGLGLDVNVVDYNGNTLLHEYALLHTNHDSYHGPMCVPFFEQLMSLGLSLEQQNFAGRTPLHILCATRSSYRHFKQGELMPIDFVISHTKNIDAADRDGNTPLHLAATVGEIYVKKLLDAGANPLVFTHEGLTPLHLASRCRESNVVGLLLDRLRQSQEESSATKASSSFAESDIGPSTESANVPKVVSGVNAQIYGRDPITPLYYASRSGRPETVALLLEAGADVKPVRVFEACAEFEEEHALWKNVHKSEDRRGNGYALALKLEDLSRPGIEVSKYNSNQLNVHETTRIEEILEILVKNGADTSELEDYSALISRRTFPLVLDHDYTAACMIDLRNDMGMSSKQTRRMYNASIITLAEAARKSRKQSSIQALKEIPLEYGTDSQSIMSRFLARREYHLVEELAHMGMTFLPVFERNDTSCLAVLIQHGFASLVDKVSTIETESRLIKGDWHAFGDKTKPGLWFANRNVANVTHKGNNPVPFLIEAVRRDLPNMDIVRLMVEKFGVDVNEAYYTSEYLDNKYKTVPSDSPIHRVSRGEHWWHVHQALPYLLKAGADIHMRDFNKQTPLHIALRGDQMYPGPFHLDAAKILVEAGADVNAINGWGESCLACAQHSIEMTRFLVSHGAKVTADAIFAAIDAKNVDILKELLAGDVSPNSRREKPSENVDEYRQKQNTITLAFLGDTLEPHEEFPLFHAAISSSLGRTLTAEIRQEIELGCQLVQLFLHHGADLFAKFLCIDDTSNGPLVEDTPTIEVPKGYKESTLLHEVFRGSKLVDPFLCLPELDVNHRDAKGCTLLHAACQGSGIPDHIINSHRANTSGTEGISVFNRLISFGADLEALDNFGHNILHCMIGSRNAPDFEGFKLSMEYVLKTAPHLANAGDAEGNTPLHYAISRAAKRSNPGVANVLLAYGADPLAINDNGDNVLHILARNLNHEDLCELFEDLFQRGANVNGRNLQGETPLFAYCRREKVRNFFRGFFGGPKKKSVEETLATGMLQRLGADFYARDAKGRGLLHAAAGGDVDRFKELLGLGLDPMLEDDMQQTAIDVAAASGNQEVLELFEKKD
ncbi:ankyrin repeat-containing domain protein [Mariannaea sp. PMI_226]|nr:ankyrin repeat-containing domain protein [Mariannaea sp. PMI_226]